MKSVVGAVVDVVEEAISGLQVDVRETNVEGL